MQDGHVSHRSASERVLRFKRTCVVTVCLQSSSSISPTSHSKRNPIPSAQSAGNDLNKIASNTQYSNPFHAELCAEAIETWASDETFKPYYHNTGAIDAVSGSEEGVKNLRGTLEAQLGFGAPVKWLDTEEDFVKHVPQLKDANIKGWKGVWNPVGGWVAARDALDSVGRELAHRGVRFTSGPSGTFKLPILSDDKTRCIGVIAEDGTEYLADRVVVAAGAWTPSLIDLKGQCLSKCWVLSHLPLAPEEVEFYKGCPVVYNADVGFFFEASGNDQIKICDEFPGFTHFVDGVTPFGASEATRISVPRSHAANPTDTVPTESITTMSAVVESMLPRLVGRSLINQKMCWCTDTADRCWLITEHPDLRGLTVASGDSGHCFVFLPIVGKYIADLLEGTLSEEKAFKWRWRPGEGDPSRSAGRDVTSQDINDLDGWKHD